MPFEKKYKLDKTKLWIYIYTQYTSTKRFEA